MPLKLACDSNIALNDHVTSMYCHVTHLYDLWFEYKGHEVTGTGSEGTDEPRVLMGVGPLC